VNAVPCNLFERVFDENCLDDVNSTIPSFRKLAFEISNSKKDIVQQYLGNKHREKQHLTKPGE